MTSVKAPYVIKELASSAGGGSRRFTLDSQGFSYILELIQGREANVQRFGPRSQPTPSGAKAVDIMFEAFRDSKIDQDMYNAVEGGGVYYHRAAKGLMDSMGSGCITVIATENNEGSAGPMVGVALSPSSRTSYDAEGKKPSRICPEDLDAVAEYKAKCVSSEITNQTLSELVNNDIRLVSFLAVLPEHADMLKGPIVQLLKEASGGSRFTVAENDEHLVTTF